MPVINNELDLFTHNLQEIKVIEKLKNKTDPILDPDPYKLFMRFRIRQKIMKIRPDPYQQQW